MIPVVRNVWQPVEGGRRVERPARSGAAPTRPCFGRAAPSAPRARPPRRTRRGPLRPCDGPGQPRLPSRVVCGRGRNPSWRTGRPTPRPRCHSVRPPETTTDGWRTGARHGEMAARRVARPPIAGSPRFYRAGRACHLQPLRGAPGPRGAGSRRRRDGGRLELFGRRRSARLRRPSSKSSI